MMLKSWQTIFLFGTAFLCVGVYFLNLQEDSVFCKPWHLEPIYNFQPNNDSGPNSPAQPEKEAFYDELSAPLLSLYKRKARGELNTSSQTFRSGSVPKVVVWAVPVSQRFWNSQLTHVRDGLCPLPCEITFDLNQANTSDAIVIYLRNVRNSQSVASSLGPRDPKQPWIMLTFEAPTLANSIHKTKYGDFNGFFNRTMMYRRDADIKLPHGFIVQRGKDAASLPQSWTVPPVQDVGSHTRKLAVSFISNCNSKTLRLHYVRQVQKYAPVDLYGKCGDLKCGHSMYVDHMYNPITDPCLKMAGETYLFYFAFENAFCADYVTEKVYNLLRYPVVPVVRGSADYSKLLPPNSYIDASTYSPKELAERLLYLQKHPQKYQKYLEWRQHFQASTIGGERTFCHLCTRLYDPDLYEHKVIDDFEDWFVYKSRCVALLNL